MTDESRCKRAAEIQRISAALEQADRDGDQITISHLQSSLDSITADFAAPDPDQNHDRGRLETEAK